MAQVTFKGNPIQTSGEGVKPGDKAPDFTCIGNDLSAKSLGDYKGNVVVLCAVPSLDTPVCDTEARRFNQEAGKLGDGVAVLAISRDLPFAQKRWCGAAGAEKVETLSDWRDRSFGQAYGLEITDSALQGLLARAVIVVGKDGKVAYSELVPEIAQEPNYDAALEAVKSAS